MMRIDIDKTVKCIEQVENKYMTGARVKKRIELGVNGNLPTFLQSLDQIDDAIKFFNRNSNFKGAKKLNEHLVCFNIHFLLLLLSLLLSAHETHSICVVYAWM